MKETEQSLAVIALQEKLMSDIISEFALLTTLQKVELLAKLSTFHCVRCNSDVIPAGAGMLDTNKTTVHLIPE